MAHHEKKIKEENGVTGSMILITFFSISLTLLLTLPNIYLDNQIYHESRAIAQQQRILRTLQEEQTIIKNRLEVIHYHENVTLNQDVE